jgi:hypothetical protein
VKITWTAISARFAALVVAAVAGAASFSHIADVAIGAGERVWVGYALPLAIDGLIVVGVAALLEDKRTNRIPRLSARFAVMVGVLATLAANIASAEPTSTARLVAVAAPVSFLLSIEVLTRTGKPRKDDDLQPVAVEVEEAPREVSGPTKKGKGKVKKADFNGGRKRGDAARRVAEVLKRDPDAAKNISRLAEQAKVSWATAKQVAEGDLVPN